MKRNNLINRGLGAYLVLDLKDWSVCYLEEAPKGGWDEKYKSEKLVLRFVPAGTFLMGSPEEELGRLESEKLHEVTLTKDYYVGIFPVTQKQYELIAGADIAYFKGGLRPAECVSYDMIRGKSLGGQWPLNHDVDEDSFLGKLRAKSGLEFDLPTEAQWEYACRAETVTALNDGTDLDDTDCCPSLDQLGRYYGNMKEGKGGFKEGHTSVGTYLPNKWGVYDMHGNVWEWCLDRCSDFLKDQGKVTDPVGSVCGPMRVFRGGSWVNYAEDCRSANRNLAFPDRKCNYIGFRLVINMD
ncbi:formylglycine-generating enzyme family protein [bacterium]|nr:formylglycine-generating enzyme family protein [bacterium]